MPQKLKKSKPGLSPKDFAIIDQILKKLELFGCEVRIMSMSNGFQRVVKEKSATSHGEHVHLSMQQIVTCYILGNLVMIGFLYALYLLL